MTTRITKDSNSSGTSSALVPALGETWAHSANMRIVLTWKHTRRCASITKSSFMPDANIFYKISVFIYIFFFIMLDSLMNLHLYIYVKQRKSDSKKSSQLAIQINMMA